ncbi:hypothetical protein HNQ91_005290 [Filimonas zeae]|nr:lipid A deacylase LpxR family protein [Filimonas zeae]MDR6342213.1 hypothetical protein [Filimonas zeae]
MNRQIRYPVWLLVMFLSVAFYPQAQEYKHLLRGFDDNDGIDIRGMGSDEGYTNGTRIDLLYQPAKQRSLLYRLLPKAGDSSITTYGWGIMQVMYTPNQLKTPFPPANDYPYAGGLFAAHTFHSANPLKKLNLQSEIIVGVMGPPSLAEGFQKFIHKTFGFITPRGWDSQMPTDLLLNYNFTVEKGLYDKHSLLDVSAGAQLAAGTMQNSGYVYGLLRLGKRSPYYSGLIQQYTPPPGDAKRWQLHAIIKPGAQLMLYNALFQGGMFNKESPYRGKVHGGHHSVQPVKWVGRFDFGVMASSGRASVLFMQSLRTREAQGIRPHSVGTISLQLAW